jgi:energy-coupling factor transporter ATP-binding protein EcfA2
MSLLQVDAINTYYGDAHALFDVSLRVEENEVVALLGRNGAGKSTTLKTIMGVLAPESGAIRLSGVTIAGAIFPAASNRCWRSRARPRARTASHPARRAVRGTRAIDHARSDPCLPPYRRGGAHNPDRRAECACRIRACASVLCIEQRSHGIRRYAGCPARRCRIHAQAFGCLIACLSCGGSYLSR